MYDIYLHFSPIKNQPFHGSVDIPYAVRSMDPSWEWIVPGLRWHLVVFTRICVCVCVFVVSLFFFLLFELCIIPSSVQFVLFAAWLFGFL